MNLWAELSKHHAIIRVRPCKHGLRGSASLSTISRLVWVHARVTLRKGETVETMLWRGLAELNRRATEGMPQPSVKAKAQRADRKIRKQAETEFRCLSSAERPM